MEILSTIWHYVCKAYYWAWRIVFIGVCISLVVSLGTVGVIISIIAVVVISKFNNFYDRVMNRDGLVPLEGMREVRADIIGATIDTNREDGEPNATVLILEYMEGDTPRRVYSQHIPGVSVGELKAKYKYRKARVHVDPASDFCLVKLNKIR